VSLQSERREDRLKLSVSAEEDKDLGDPGSGGARHGGGLRLASLASCVQNIRILRRHSGGTVTVPITYFWPQAGDDERDQAEENDDREVMRRGSTSLGSVIFGLTRF